MKSHASSTVNSADPKSSGTVCRILLPLALALGAPSPVLAQEGQVPVKIGVLAKRGVEKCREKWAPTADYLTEQIPGHSFVIVPLGYDELCPAVERGEVDFVLPNPGLYVTLERFYGVSRLATLNNRPLREACTVYGGVIFRRADRGDIEHLADLKGKTFMAVDERSFGGWQAAWRELKEHGIDPYRDFADLSFGRTHDAVVQAVRDGKVDAGTVRTETLEQMAEEGTIRLDDFRAFTHDHIDREACYFPFLHSTETYPEWPLAKVKHTSDELAETVALALLNMPADGPAANAAHCAGWVVPHNYQPVHECLKDLRIGPYKDFGKITLGGVLKRYWPWLASTVVLLTGMAVTLVCVLRLNRTLSQSRLDLARELAERKRAEQALQEESSRLRSLVSLLDAMDVGLTIQDRDYNITYQNPFMQKQFGGLGEKCYKIYERQDEVCDGCPVAKAFKDGQPHTADRTTPAPGGGVFFWENTAHPIKDAASEVTSCFEVVRNITKRKRAEAELQKA